MARLGDGGIAVKAILLAVAANAAIKAVYAGVIAGRVLLVPVLASMAAVLIALATGAVLFAR